MVTARTALGATLFWMLAAASVLASNIVIAPRWPRLAGAVAIAAILAASCGYSRLFAPHEGASHALGVGTTWLVLSVASELAVTTHLGHAWFALLGSADRPLLRNVLLFFWIFAPALFARRET